MTANQFIATKLNLDKHYSLLESGDLTYMLNGDIEGYESSNQNYYVQNQKSNELCFNLEGYEFVGPGIPVGVGEHVFFISSTDPENPNSQILLCDLNNCTYGVVASGECLGFDSDYPIRGVYKYNSQNNTRRVYFIDGLNPNRYIDIDKPFPQQKITDDCETCERQYNGLLDCNQLKINKDIPIPCLSLEANAQGQLSNGVYQVGFAWSQDGIVLSDFYFSDVLKVWSEKGNIGLNINIECIDTNVFDEYTLVLVTTTREGSNVLYKLGSYSFPNDSVFITSLDNTTVIDLSVATQKRVKYDKSQHITTNGETLLLGKSESLSTIPYQIQATGIEVGWKELKVPKEQAHLYPNLLRDEVYELAIEVMHLNGQSLGRFHVPGRPYNDTYSYNPGLGFPIDYHEHDVVPSGFNIYANPDCESEDVSAWQIANSAYIEGNLSGDCSACGTSRIGKYGKMGYYECLDITYPDEPDVWGELACQRIRRHRMPSHNLSHIYEPGDCELVGLSFPIFGDVTATSLVEGDCVNILALDIKNVPYPLDVDGNPIPDIAGFRILYAKRDSNKSILHKGLIFNMFQESVINNDSPELILYPNYPFNDLKPDVFLGKEQSPNWDQAYTHEGSNIYTSLQWTYHSPDILFKEQKNEFGSEMRLYTGEKGFIFGDISKVYKHPEQSLNKSDGVVGANELYNYANSINLVANFADYVAANQDFYQSWRIDESQFLLPIKQFVGNQKINNLYRESSYYMNLNDTGFFYPISFFEGLDTSRFLASELVDETIVDNININYCSSIDRDEVTYDIQAQSAYVGIKIQQPNQYGQVGSSIYVPIDSCLYSFGDVTAEVTVQGGDTYISRHSILRKMPLFTEWLYDVPFDTLIDYRDKRNIYFPQFWYDNLTLDYSALYNLDNLYDDDGFTKGRFYSHVNGNAYFWCESEFIGDYRETDMRFQTEFYPKQSVKEITRSDKFNFQQIWLYNFALLQGSIDQNSLTSRVGMKNALDPDYNIGDFITHYSLKDDAQSGYDNWLNFAPLNYTVLPRTYGQFTGMHFIDQYSILFEFENGTLHSQEDYTLTVNQGNSLFLAQGDIFSRRLRKWSNELTGYTGSVDPFFPCNSRYGFMYYDRYRKSFFMWDGQLKPLNDLKSFLNNFNLDTNPGYNNSLISVYDNLTDKIYITDKQTGWTISFSPKLGGFISFHSFVPDWYVSHYNTFFSIKNNSLWRHNADGYQNYYGEQFPFEVEFVIKDVKDILLQDINLFVDYIDYQGYNQVVQRSDKFFNKLFVYNNRYSTGILNLNLVDLNNPNASIQNAESQGIADVSQVSENIYRINKLESNQVDSPNMQFDSNGVTYTITNINQNKAPHNKSLMMGRWFKAHLIDDQNSSSKILVQLNLSQTDETKR